MATFSGPLSPAGAQQGDLWYNTNSGQEFVLVTGVWTPVSTASAAGTPVSSALGTNVTSITPAGDDEAGILTVAMSGAGAVGANLGTISFANARLKAPKLVLVINGTATSLAATNFQTGTLSVTGFNLLVGSVALATGTYIVQYFVVG